MMFKLTYNGPVVSKRANVTTTITYLARQYFFQGYSMCYIIGNMFLMFFTDVRFDYGYNFPTTLPFSSTARIRIPYILVAQYLLFVLEIENFFVHSYTNSMF